MYIFIADIHIRPGNFDDERVFLEWLVRYGHSAQEIYILGDLFDYWYSGMEKMFPWIIGALDTYRIKIIPGNRDFLMLSSCLKSVEGREEIVLELYGRRCLAAHGHSITQNDTSFRALHFVLWPLLKYLDRRLDVLTKAKIAARMIRASSIIRPLSIEIKQGVCAEKGVDTVICGHLHRGIMRKDLIVLPPFATERAWLVYDERGPAFCRIA